MRRCDRLLCVKLRAGVHGARPVVLTAPAARAFVPLAQDAMWGPRRRADRRRDRRHRDRAADRCGAVRAVVPDRCAGAGLSGARRVPDQPSVRPKNRIVRSHAMPAQAASYCVIGSRRGPCAVSLANA
jgi:hypothetical protein